MVVDSRPLTVTGREQPTPSALDNDGNPLVSSLACLELNALPKTL